RRAAGRLPGSRLRRPAAELAHASAVPGAWNPGARAHRPVRRRAPGRAAAPQARGTTRAHDAADHVLGEPAEEPGLRTRLVVAVPAGAGELHVRHLPPAVDPARVRSHPREG